MTNKTGERANGIMNDTIDTGRIAFRRNTQIWRLIAIFMVLIIGLLMLNGAVIYAEGNVSAVLTVTASKITVGDTFDVKLSLSSDTEEMSKVWILINFDSEVIECIGIKSDSGAMDSSKVDIHPGDWAEIKDYTLLTPAKTCGFTLTFKALAAGHINISIDESIVEDIEGNIIDSPQTSTGVKIESKTEPIQKSSNANLKDLEIPHGKLNPTFSSEITKYKVTVPYNITEFPLMPKKEDSNAKVAFEGSTSLVVGMNTRAVIVTAEDGTTKIYTVTITREAAPSDLTERPTERPTEEPTENPSSTPSLNTPEIETSEAPSESTQKGEQTPEKTEGSPVQTIDEKIKQVKLTIVKVLVIMAILIIAGVFGVVFFIRRKENSKVANSDRWE